MQFKVAWIIGMVLCKGISSGAFVPEAAFFLAWLQERLSLGKFRHMACLSLVFRLLLRCHFPCMIEFWNLRFVPNQTLCSYFS